MKRIIVILLGAMGFVCNVYSNGILLVDAEEKIYLKLTDCNVNVKVENQIAIVTYSETFTNTGSSDVNAKYAFPLPEGGSSISLKWKIYGQEHSAGIKAQPQDTTLPGTGGGGNNQKSELDKYLGPVPIYFDLPDSVAADSTIQIEHTYVQLLPYDFGNVQLELPFSITNLLGYKLNSFKLDFKLDCNRKLEKLELVGNDFLPITISDYSASFGIVSEEQPASANFVIRYQLNTDTLGLFGYSTYQNTVVDSLDKGYFLFIAEPDPSDKTDAMNKYFTFIIDRSGSMNGNKIVQAREAAKFIVNNLNDGDYFNIVDFNSSVRVFKGQHVEYNGLNKNQALDFINQLTAGGSTNISGAFETALAQFPDKEVAEDEGLASIVLFFTDGMPTSGITRTDDLLNFISEKNEAKNATIYSFGIGQDVNEYLVSQISGQNNGLVKFIESQDLEEEISDFYLRIRNPVLIEPKVSFSPNVVKEVWPDKLPNLYKGQQMMVAGRYNEPLDSLKIVLEGKAFGKSVKYEYYLSLSADEIDKYNFLGKIWAKIKIESLIRRYYQSLNNKTIADSIKEDIVDISLKYRILTEFTSYKGKDDNFIPVELITFKAIPSDKWIGLYWETASETNNYGFYIDRMEFESGEEWEEIGFVKGFGQSSSLKSYSFKDFSPRPGKVYQYRLRQVDLDGTVNYNTEINTITVSFEPVLSLTLNPCYPNPFSGQTFINFELSRSQYAMLEVVDLFGKPVRTLFKGFKEAGFYQMVWDGNNGNGAKLPAGTYIIKLTTENGIFTNNVSFIK